MTIQQQQGCLLPLLMLHLPLLQVQQLVVHQLLLVLVVGAS
jgi:hypothetical protein